MVVALNIIIVNELLDGVVAGVATFVANGCSPFPLFRFSWALPRRLTGSLPVSRRWALARLHRKPT
jgi:hypothetical protein